MICNDHREDEDMIQRLIKLMYGPCLCACAGCKRGQHCNGVICAHDA